MLITEHHGSSTTFQRRYAWQAILRATLLIAIILCGLAVLVGFGRAPSTAAAKASSPDSAVYFGIEYPGSPDISKLQSYEAEIQHGIPLVLWYLGWEVAGNQTVFPAAGMDSVRQHGSIPVLAWYPMDGTIGTVNQTKFQLARIIHGDWDSYIRQFATGAKAWGHPFFMRFASEMNGNWTPWSEMVNGNQAGQYAQAWRHVHDIFAQVGVTNATWAWCPNVENTQTTPLEDLYPGSAYVDWACLDGYNFAGDSEGGPWRSFSEIFHGTYQHLLSLIPPTMPILIGETGSVERGGSKPDWIKDALSVQLPTAYARIKGVIWFQDTNPGIDLRFDTTPQSLAALRAALTSNVYVENTFRYLDKSPIPAPGSAGLKPTSPPVFHDAPSPAAGYVQVLDSAQNAPLPNAKLIYAGGISPATNAQGLVAMPEGAKQVTLNAVDVSGGMLAVSLSLDRRLGYQIQIDLKAGNVISVRIHDPPLPPAPPKPPSLASTARAALTSLKAAPRPLAAMIGLAALTLFITTFLMVIRGAAVGARRLRKRRPARGTDRTKGFARQPSRPWGTRLPRT